MQYFPGVQESISFREMIDNSKMIEKTVQNYFGGLINDVDLGVFSFCEQPTRSREKWGKAPH